METFERLAEELGKHVPFRIRFKDESTEMEVLDAFVGWYCPDFMTNYTTVIGSTVYFPNRYEFSSQPYAATRSLAHEAVHMLDAHRYSNILFSIGYLFPQLLVFGVLLFPFIGLHALWFLLFALPLPSPIRFYFESRAYAIDVLTAEPEDQATTFEWAIKHFESWNYYKMWPFKDSAEKAIRYWITQAEKGKDPVLIQVLLMYEWAMEG